MFLEPNNLAQYTPTQILESAAQGHVGLDHRFLHSLVDRRDEALPAVLGFAKRDRDSDAVDLTPELIALLRHWRTPEAVPCLIDYIWEDPEEIADEVIEALVEIGAPAIEPLIALRGELDNSAGEEIDFILDHVKAAAADPSTLEPFDIWAEYPEQADVPIELLSEDERTELLTHPVEAVRLAAAGSFFNRELSDVQKHKLLSAAQHDESAAVRGKCWEALLTATEDNTVVEAMLQRMRAGDVSSLECGGLLVGLSSEADRNEVRVAMNELYETTEGRAKALEAMWRSLHPSFREKFAKHLDDSDLEVRRSAVWGIGYYGIKTELDSLRKLFEDEDLRSDALFAYALAVPGEVSRGRMKGLLTRIEKDARGVSEMEEELVKTALDERLMLAGKEPFFAMQED
ncbi:MAG: HEAT repeat domain-containing protein [Acidobacteriaceae bacterium]|nr:HEAT repeat domain-containing protein [Acidobacteriaceae bacterium]